MNMQACFTESEAKASAEIIYATWGHLEGERDVTHDITILFAVDSRTWFLLDYKSPTHDESPGIFWAVEECLNKVVFRDKHKWGFDMLSAGVYELKTTYKRGKGCRYGKNFIKLKKVYKGVL